MLVSGPAVAALWTVAAGFVVDRLRGFDDAALADAWPSLAEHPRIAETGRQVGKDDEGLPEYGLDVDDRVVLVRHVGGTEVPWYAPGPLTVSGALGTPTREPRTVVEVPLRATRPGVGLELSEPHAAPEKAGHEAVSLPTDVRDRLADLAAFGRLQIDGGRGTVELVVDPGESATLSDPTALIAHAEAVVAVAAAVETAVQAGVGVDVDVAAVDSPRDPADDS